jgi:hypothetical protein
MEKCLTKRWKLCIGVQHTIYLCWLYFWLYFLNYFWCLELSTGVAISNIYKAFIFQGWLKQVCLLESSAFIFKCSVLSELWFSISLFRSHAFIVKDFFFNYTCLTSINMSIRILKTNENDSSVLISYVFADVLIYSSELKMLFLHIVLRASRMYARIKLEFL